ncbi:YlbF family regulator, partial [Dysosmobacter welbionis]
MAAQPTGPVLVGVGAVVQRLLEKSLVAEGVIQFFLQIPHIVHSQKEAPLCAGRSCKLSVQLACHVIHRVAHGLDGLDLVLRR